MLYSFRQNCRIREGSVPELEANKETVRAFYDLAFNQAVASSSAYYGDACAPRIAPRTDASEPRS